MTHPEHVDGSKLCPNDDDDFPGDHTEAREPHPCPFKSDVRGDDTTLCRCCKECERECLMDI